MTIETVVLASQIDLETLVEIIECGGRSITLSTTLKSKPDCSHFHVKKSNRLGTLEITLLADRLTVEIGFHDNRAGDGWMESDIKELVSELGNLTRVEDKLR